MRHSRRAVMAERYKLYVKKNIFNSKYLVRNLQIGMLSIVVLAMIVGTVVLVSSSSDRDVVLENTKKVKVENAKVSVKDALFGATEEVTETTEVVVEQETSETEVTESVIAEKVRHELDDTIVEIVSNVATNQDKKREPIHVESEFDNKCIAKVDETLNIRKSASADSEFVGQMNNGAIAIVQGTEGEWTKIKSGDVEGYVLTEYVLTGANAEEFAKDYVTLVGKVLEDGVNIRADKSTDAEILEVKEKDDTVLVIEKPDSEENVSAEDEIIVEAKASESADQVSEETDVYISETTELETSEESTEDVQTEEKEPIENQETKDSIVWVTVSLEDGRTGYVSQEFLDIQELYEIAVSAEELQRREEEAARKAAEEEAARQAAAAQAAQAAQQQQESSNSYEGATTKPVTTTESGELIGTFTITAYCGCKKCGTGSNRTASGTTPTEGRTIAADTSILPFGTQVVIGGVVYTVEDSGSGVRGNHIDIFFATHSRALAFGRKTMKVYKY